jgi:hypothetical protein
VIKLPLEILLMLFHKKEYRKPYLKYIISTVKVKYRDIVFISQKLLYQKRITNPESNSYYYYKLFNFYCTKSFGEGINSLLLLFVSIQQLVLN